MADTTVKTIPQSKIARYRDLLDSARELESLKKELIELCLNGAKCASGPLAIKLKVRSGSRRPAWAELYAELARETYGEFSCEAHLEEIRSNAPMGSPSYSLEFFDRDSSLEI